MTVRDTPAADPGDQEGGALLAEDSGVPKSYVRSAFIVGLALVCFGAAMIYLFGREVPIALPALAMCVGFGLVLAAFGSRAGGRFAGFAVVGAGALSIVLFILLFRYIPDGPIAYIKRGQIGGNLDNVAYLQIVDHDPLYTLRDVTTRSIRFVLLESNLKTPQLRIQVDTLDDDEEYFEIVCESEMIKKRYLSDTSSVISWTLDYERRRIRESGPAGQVICSQPEVASEELLQFGSTWQLPRLVSAAYAQPPEDLEISGIIKNLQSDDTIIRRKARQEIADFGPALAAELMAALRQSPDVYRLRLGIIFGLAEMLRRDPDQNEALTQVLTEEDLALLVSAAADEDRTIRLQATEFLYLLQDPRIAELSLSIIKSATNMNGIYNNVLILKPVFPQLETDIQQELAAELWQSIPESSARTRELLGSFTQPN